MCCLHNNEMKQMKAKKTKSPNLSEVYHNFTSKGLGFFSLFIF